MVENLNDFMLEQLKDIYDAEQKAVEALPRLAEAATAPEVKKAFEDHLEQTRKQVSRLEEIFKKMDTEAEAKPCKGMEGLIEEAEEYIEDEELSEEFRDAALVSAEQKAEHYEISAYQSAFEMAEMMGNRHAARLLRQSLGEEERMSKKLSQLSAKWLRKAVREYERSEAA